MLDLGDMPLANDLLSEDDLGQPERRYPLALAFCEGCWLAQITHPVPPDILFRGYPYFSSVSATMVEHARRIAERLIDERHLDGQSLVLEIGSNDGYLLRHYAARGIPVLGIEPAENVARSASACGVPTLGAFFGATLGDTLARSGKLADVVHANNVMAHVPDINGFVRGLAAVLRPSGVAVIETPSLRELIDGLAFDTIYHEHVFYYSLSSLERLLGRHGMTIVHVERLAIHCGSLRLFVTHAASARVARPVVRAMLAEEDGAGLREIGCFQGFADRVRGLGIELRSLLWRLKGDGKRIAAYGAAAKGTIRLNALGIGPDAIEFVADRSPHKQGRFIPGVRVPIRSADHLVASRPDVCLLLAWNLADEVLMQQAAFRGAGGRFILPGPALRIV